MSHSRMKEQMEKGERKNPNSPKFTANTASIVSEAMMNRLVFPEFSFGDVVLNQLFELRFSASTRNTFEGRIAFLEATRRIIIIVISSTVNLQIQIKTLEKKSSKNRYRFFNLRKYRIFARSNTF